MPAAHEPLDRVDRAPWGWSRPGAFAGSPTSVSPLLVKATTEGVIRLPSWLGMTVTSPPSMTATALLVVPRSIPMIFSPSAMTCLPEPRVDVPGRGEAGACRGGPGAGFRQPRLIRLDRDRPTSSTRPLPPPGCPRSGPTSPGPPSRCSAMVMPPRCRIPRQDPGSQEIRCTPPDHLLTRSASGLPALPPGPLPLPRFVPHALLDPELEARCDVAGRLLGVSQPGPQGLSSRSILRCRGIPILEPAIPRDSRTDARESGVGSAGEMK